MKKVLALATVAALALGVLTDAAAQCPPSCPLSGGGDETTDCHSELASTAMSLNSPFFNPIKLKPAKEHRCFDGDPGCDLDATVNGACRFDIDVCFRNADPNLPGCTPADVTAFDVKGESKFPGFAALESAASALLPATSNVCTTGQSVTLALKQTSKGILKRSRLTFATTSTTASAKDKDKVKMSCVPARWPKHGFDHRNTRSNPLESSLTPANAAGLVAKWNFHISDSFDSSVTSTPTVGRKLVYVTAWDGKVYALDRKKGKVKWTYDTESKNPSYDIDGVQTSATLTADGRLIVGDANGDIHCLDAKKGGLLWKSSIGEGDESTDGAHAWSSATVANNRVFVGRSSHLDTPCTQGGIYAFDLDTGAQLWQFDTVPDNVCDNDTNIECSMNSDCGAGTCVPGLGGGVTATAATSNDGETVYLSVIGCYTFPSIGNSDAIISLNAATGALNWSHRTRTVEQFIDGPPYHDYGFVNGPILMDIPDGAGTQEVVVAGSKDGSLYAIDTATGTAVWVREVQPATDFVAFGLFNGAIGAADDKIFASLFDLEFPTTNEGLDRLHAFDSETGATSWSAQTDVFSWSDVALAGGLLFVGEKALPGVGESPTLNVYDADTGALLRTLGVLDGILSPVVGGSAVVDGTLYVPYGTLGGQGGLAAFEVPE